MDLVSAACATRAGKGKRALRRSPGRAMRSRKERRVLPSAARPSDLSPWSLAIRFPVRRCSGPSLARRLGNPCHSLGLSSAHRAAFAPHRLRPALTGPLQRLGRVLAHRLRHHARPRFRIPSRSIAVSRRHLRSIGPCRRLIRGWFPATEPTSYRSDGLTDSESHKATNRAPWLWITWKTGTRAPVIVPAATRAVPA